MKIAEIHVTRVTARKSVPTFSVCGGVLCFSNEHFVFYSLDNKVSLTKYSADAEGMIQSFISRFPGHDDVLEELWKADQPYHKYF